MTCAVVTQPNYLPWLGYFEQVARADVFVFLDTVQFAEREWQSRNRLKGADEAPFWLTVPLTKHPRNIAIDQVLISNTQPDWVKKHLRAITTSLGGAPYFSEIFPKVENWLNQPFQRLVDLNVAGIEMFSSLLNVGKRFVRASSLTATGKRTELLVNLCKAVGATHYYSSLGARSYLEADRHMFEDAQITIEYQHWEHPVYIQRGKSFVSHLSVVDCLMNLGCEGTRKLICH